jgi:hypothetical protein
VSASEAAVNDAIKHGRLLHEFSSLAEVREDVTGHRPQHQAVAIRMQWATSLLSQGADRDWPGPVTAGQDYRK